MSKRREIVREGGTPSLPKGRVAMLAILMASVFLPLPVYAQDTITNVMSSVVSYQFYDSLGADTNSVITSPVASYQFYDSLEHLDTNSVIMSPVASYQYFDWPDSGSVQFLNSPAVSYFYGTAGTVGHVQATQRPGTTLVDLFYDLTGAGSDYYLSVAVSSDGGATFTVAATHFTGDGVMIPAAPAANRHIVWDAGADFPGQFSTQMRVTVMAGSASALSPIFTLDTRPVTTGTLTGLVQGNGAPVANAQVRIDGTGFAASTGADGRFALANVPAGTGYLLRVSAAGFASKQVPGITVTSGTTDLGTIQLVPLIGPYRVLPLQPDVNPPVTRIEDGGVAYRYYKIVTADGQSHAGQVTVSLRIAGGSAVPQTGDTSAYWPGSTAGVSDDDGIVRLRIPASAIGGPGASARLEVVESGNVRLTFTAEVLARKYDQIWKKKWHGVAGINFGVGSVGLGFGHETTVTRAFGNAAVGKEVVGHWREEVYRAGVGLGPSIHVNRIGGGFTGQRQGRITIGLGQSFHFDPQTTDAYDNLLKFYAAYADALNLVPFGGTIIEGVQEEIMNLGSPVEANEAALRVTGSAEAEAGIGGLSPLPGDVAIHFWADESGDLEVELGGDNHPSQYVDRYLEFGTGWAQDVQWNLGPRAVPEAMFQDRDSSLRAAVRRTADDRRPSELIVESSVEVTAGTPRAVGGWLTDDLVQLRNQEVARYKNTCALGVPSASDALPIALNAWQAVNSLGQGAVFRSGDAAEMVSSVLSAGQTVAYEKSVYSAETTVSSFLPNFDVVLSLDASAEDEKGAEVKKEAGVIWQDRLLGLEAYADQPRDYYPTETLSDLQGRWMANARGPMDQLLNRAASVVTEAGEVFVQAGNETRRGALQIWSGYEFGWDILTSWEAEVFYGAPSGLLTRLGPKADVYSGPLPPPGSSNFVYGLGGVFRFESTNAFPGTGTLSIAYLDEEMGGLEEADLRIYRWDVATNRWTLVGGEVDTASNLVSVPVTNWGTYAIAPPLPTGDLILTPSTNTLAADGASQMTVVVTNLMLNTGNVATQQWMFTATAAGMSILNPDLDPTTPGVQVVSTNGAVTLLLRGPVGGTVARVSLASVVGDAFGSVAINLLDNAPPATPSGVTVMAGQSRIWVSWQTNSEPDIAGYRVYYRSGASGPAWDGTAAVEGAPSPVLVTGTNCLLRGLVLGTNYFVSVSAVDTTGNESPLSGPTQVTTTPTPPVPPTAVVARFGADGTNILMWALSEDDGYNNRDVVRYDVLRAVLPGGSYVKVGEACAGVGLYSETNLTVGPAQFVRYAVIAVDSNGVSSAQALGNRLLAGGNVFDNDGDGMPDDWELRYGLNPLDPGDALADNDHDGVSNLQEYLDGTDPNVVVPPVIKSVAYLLDGSVRLAVDGERGHSYTLEASTTLRDWSDVAGFVCTNKPTVVLDPTATNYRWRFYRVGIP